LEPEIVNPVNHMYNSSPAGTPNNRREVRGPVPDQQGFPPEGYTVVECNMRDQTFCRADLTGHDGAERPWKPKGRS